MNPVASPELSKRAITEQLLFPEELGKNRCQLPAPSSGPLLAKPQLYERNRGGKAAGTKVRLVIRAQ